MYKSVTVKAPAKINLGLRVLPRREDGYHNIESIFTTVGLYDELTVSLTDEKNKISVCCEGMELPEENTFTAAYKAFCVLTGCDTGCSVKVTKHIPSGGGLGGGSSDASSFIKSIDMLCTTKLSADAMNAIAAKVGSDVFFFTNALLSQNAAENKPFAALVTGRGELIQQIPSREDLTIVLVFPEICVSTKEAYNLVDGQNEHRSSIALNELEPMFLGPVEDWRFSNDFTAPVCSRFPEIGEVLKAVKETGAVFADMSGSGSTVFGIYRNVESAEKAQKVLGLKWKSVLA